MIRPQRVHADLARYADGELTREELRELHPDHELDRSLDLHDRLSALRSEPVSLPDWATLAPSLSAEPGPGRRAKRRAFALLLAGGLVVAPAVAEAVSPGSVRRTILDPVADVLPFVDGGTEDVDDPPDDSGDAGETGTQSDRVDRVPVGEPVDEPVADRVGPDVPAPATDRGDTPESGDDRPVDVAPDFREPAADGLDGPDRPAERDDPPTTDQPPADQPRAEPPAQPPTTDQPPADPPPPTDRRDAPRDSPPAAERPDALPSAP